jgi:quercetin dioxygenase-like cupin family protein
VEIVELRSRDVGQFGSAGVEMLRLLPVHVTTGAASLHVARIAPGGTLGRHPSRQWQLFAVVEGSGWVTGTDDVRHEIGAGQAAVWAPGEEHAAGSAAGMLAVIAQSDVPPVPA